MHAMHRTNLPRRGRKHGLLSRANKRMLAYVALVALCLLAWVLIFAPAGRAHPEQPVAALASVCRTSR
jgi:hypothetical protein